MLIQSALVDADQVQPSAVMTLKLPPPPLSSNSLVYEFNRYTQSGDGEGEGDGEGDGGGGGAGVGDGPGDGDGANALWFTVNVRPAIVTVDDRAAPLLLSTEMPIVASPVPLGVCTCTHEAWPTAVHPQAGVADSRTEREPPAEPIPPPVLASENWHGAAACGTVKG